MILQFSVKNFKSIKNELTIDFRKVNIVEHKESLINDAVLPVAVFYGPNGAGKSNILKAMGYLFQLIAAPIHTNEYLKRGSNTIVGTPELYPYKFNERSKNSPSEFNIIFTLSKDNPNEYSYYIKIKDNKVLNESLYEKQPMGKPAKIYERNHNDVDFGTKYPKINKTEIILSESYPFLSSVALLFNVPIYKEVVKFFTNSIILDFSDPRSEEIVAEVAMSLVLNNKNLKPHIVNILKSFNLGIKDYFIDEQKQGSSLKRFNLIHDNGSLPLLEESMGTRKIFMSLAPIWLCLNSGYPLVIDELDAKLHPKLLQFIIEMFTNQNINKKGSQLVITSHDMYTLSKEVFRRDEVWFVAKDLDDSTFCYCLVDIKNEKNEKERNFNIYSKRYLEGKYGADPYFKKMNSWEELTGEE